MTVAEVGDNAAALGSAALEVLYRQNVTPTPQFFNELVFTVASTTGIARIDPNQMGPRDTSSGAGHTGLVDTGASVNVVALDMLE